MSRIDYGRYGDRGRNQVKQIACRTRRAGPNGHGQKHDIHHRKSCDTQSHNKIATDGVAFLAQSSRVQKMRVISHVGQRGGQPFPGQICLHIHALLGQVHSRAADIGHAVQLVFNRRNAGGTPYCRHRQLHRVRRRCIFNSRGCNCAGRAGGCHSDRLTTMRCLKVVPSPATATTRKFQLPNPAETGATNDTPSN